MRRNWKFHREHIQRLFLVSTVPCRYRRRDAHQEVQMQKSYVSLLDLWQITIKIDEIFSISIPTQYETFQYREEIQRI